jgi:curved DNA-binding protein CbpA
MKTVSVARLTREAGRATESSAMRTPYDILGVPRSASEETIKAAFNRAAKACHPDLNPDVPEEKLRQVIDACHILKCPKQRAAYDLALNLRDAFNALEDTDDAPKDTDFIAERNHRRALARRFANAAFVGLASSGALALTVWLSVSPSPSHKQVAAAPAAPLASLAMEWERVEASGDPKAIWAFAVRNPNAPQSTLARSRLMEMIETVEDVSLLKVFQLVASHEVAERARERLVRLGASTTKEGSAPSANPTASAHQVTDVVGREEPAVQEPGVTTGVAVREEPAVQEPGVTIGVAVREDPTVQEPGVTTAVVVREEPASHELKAGTKRAVDQPVVRKLTRAHATAVKRLAKGHDPVRPVTAENRSSALFGVGF